VKEYCLLGYGVFQLGENLKQAVECYVEYFMHYNYWYFEFLNECNIFVCSLCDRASLIQ